MPRYFFNMHDQGYVPDDEGVELKDLAAARHAAMQALPAIASDHISDDGDRQHYAVVVTDDSGRPLYSATLSYVGLWLAGAPAESPVSPPAT